MLVAIGQWLLPALFAVGAAVVLPLQRREWRQQQTAARAAIEANLPVGVQEVS